MGYGAWYPLHPSTKELAVPFSRSLGRLYERDAWLPDLALDDGRDGILDSRTFASRRDKRIISGTTWLFADSRADALDIHTINGVDIGRYDVQRDPKGWRKSIKTIEASASISDQGALPEVSLRRFMATGTEESNTSSSKRHFSEISGDDEEEIRRQTQVVTDVPYKTSRVQVIID